MAVPPVAAGPPAAFTPWRPHTWLLALTLAGVLGILLGAGIALFAPRGQFAEYRYHLWRWQAETLVPTAARIAGLGPEPASDGETDAVRRYFALTSRLRAESSRDTPDLQLITALENERALLENDVEAFLAGAITEVVESAGLQRPLPLFSGIQVTWPPVAFELTSPPRLLVRSPRDRIERLSDTLLQPGLTLADIEQVEARADTRDTVSIVVTLGGLAAYPAIVRDDRSYASVLETAAHEWVHHYLAFYPLGQQWGKGGDAETLNETVASIAGREIARLVMLRYPIDFPPGEDGSAPAARRSPDIDFTAEMRSLRLAVDDLLARGRIAEAEQLMEEKRRFLAEHGIVIRKINQAYFAFYGTYADSPQSSNPIGPLFETLWQQTGDIGEFLRIARGITSRSELEQAVAALGASP
ncbi:MAG: hypothetical protein KatS3mg062_0977 [Tepidiforma sp.]|nr:MAG: hypothetical protein KatS3mg062_0977 [Tepidiforma sp.]